MEKIEMDLEKGYRRKKKTEKRDTSKRRDVKRKEAEPAERLGRFIPDQLHFQPSSEYKRQFNYRGIFKGGSHPLSLSPSSLTVFTSAPSSTSFVPVSVNGISLRRQENSIQIRATRCRAADTHRTYVHIVRRYKLIM